VDDIFKTKNLIIILYPVYNQPCGQYEQQKINYIQKIFIQTDMGMTGFGRVWQGNSDMGFVRMGICSVAHDNTIAYATHVS
jgi:hypothetical protein